VNPTIPTWGTDDDGRSPYTLSNATLKGSGCKFPFYQKTNWLQELGWMKKKQGQKTTFVQSHTHTRTPAANHTSLLFVPHLIQLLIEWGKYKRTTANEMGELTCYANLSQTWALITP